MGDGFPKVSVIIPCYNVEKYLRDAVESVLNQTFTDYEIILVDDGSTDFTWNICKEYAESNARIYAYHQENAGQSSARNKGMGLAKGEYIYFLDSDDYVDCHMLQETVGKLDETGADIVFFNAVQIDELGNRLSEENNSYEKILKISKNGMPGSEWYLLLNRLGIFDATVWRHVFRKTFLEKGNLLFVNGIMREDELFLFEAYLEAEKVIMLPEKYYYRRVRPGSTMTSGNYLYMVDSLQTIILIILDKYKKLKDKKGKRELYARFQQRMVSLLIGLYSNISKNERIKREKKLLRVLWACMNTSIKRGDLYNIKEELRSIYFVYRMRTVE